MAFWPSLKSRPKIGIAATRPTRKLRGRMVWWCVTLDWLPAEPADIDYIMELIARYCGQDPEKVEISREQFIGLIRSDARFLDERSDISEHVHSLEEGDGLDHKPVPAVPRASSAMRDAWICAR